jgi:hypothetical protein
MVNHTTRSHSAIALKSEDSDDSSGSRLYAILLRLLQGYLLSSISR